MTTIGCECGAVRFEAEGAPIGSVICHCESCRTAGRTFDAASGRDPIVDADGGTAVVMWRKDRVRCTAGADRLASHRLTPDSPTRRMVATCCGTPMLADYTKGFWITMYRGRVAEAPAVSMRVMTGDLPAGHVLPDDGVPAMQGHSGRFMLKLMRAWIAIGFRRPKVAGLPEG